MFYILQYSQPVDDMEVWNWRFPSEQPGHLTKMRHWLSNLLKSPFLALIYSVLLTLMMTKGTDKTERQ